MGITLSEERDMSWVLIECANHMYDGWFVVVDVDTVDRNSYVGAETTQTVVQPTRSRDYRFFDITCGDISISENCVFSSKQVLKTVVSELALKGSFQYKTTKSSPKQLTLKCIEDSCQWYLRASVLSTGQLWVIRKFIADHSCAIDVVKNYHRQATATMVSQYATNILESNSKMHCTPADIIKHSRKFHGVDISYNKAWRAREKAFFSIRGTLEESYARIPTFAARLIEKNPGTYTAQEVDEDNRFKYFFMSLVASIQGWKLCVPVISINGTSLKNRFKGMMLTACTFDANSQIYPLAFAVVDSKNDASWRWFFQNLKVVFGEPNDLVIISDRHVSISNRFTAVYTSAYHGLCIYHLEQNLIKHHRGKHINDLFIKCAKSYTTTEYEYYMRQMEQLIPSIRSELVEIGLPRWCRAFSTKKRYLMMTTNISESLNSHLLEGRSPPIIPLLEFARDMLQEWFCKRRTIAGFQRHDITPYAVTHLRESLRDSRTMDYSNINEVQFQIRDGNKQFEVDISKRTCSYRRWDEDIIPCRHAARAISHKGFTLESYVHDFYRSSTLQNLYIGDVHPVCITYGSNISTMSTYLEVQPPLTKCQAERPKKKRIISHRERVTSLKCGRCGQRGHNRRRCNNPISS